MGDGLHYQVFEPGDTVRTSNGITDLDIGWDVIKKKLEDCNVPYDLSPRQSSAVGTFLGSVLSESGLTLNFVRHGPDVIAVYLRFEITHMSEL